MKMSILSQNNLLHFISQARELLHSPFPVTTMAVATTLFVVFLVALLMLSSDSQACVFNNKMESHDLFRALGFDASAMEPGQNKSVSGPTKLEYRARPAGPNLLHH